MTISGQFNRPISTHTPLARRDTASATAWPMRLKFLLTRLLRGVTIIGIADKCFGNISTHTPLARRDAAVHPTLPLSMNFYSHASCEA